MFKIIVFWTAISGPAYRQSADNYAIPGYGTVQTNACTVSAHGELTARVTRDWIYFYDNEGRLEADCARLTKKRPVVVRETLTVHRGIATVK